MSVARLGPYELLRELGRGGFGVVHLARRDGLQRQCALKVIVDTDPDLLLRFDLEARVASKLDHPGIVPVIDSGRAAGRLYYAMPYCAGPTLKQRLATGAMPIDEAARLLAEIARAADYAHQQGVLHRDLKPDNVILTEPEGRPRLTDFGMARDRSLRRSLTRTGDMMGTPAYMAPEQWRGERDVDARADVYALGVILYHCLSGQRPFLGDTITALGEQVLRGQPIPLRSVAPWVPLPLVDLCGRAIATDRRDRFPSAGALADALDGYLALGQSVRPGGPRRAVSAGVLVVLGGAAAVLAFVVARQSPAVTASTSPREETTRAQTPAPSPLAPAPPPPQPTRLAPDMEVERCAAWLVERFRLVRRYEDPDAGARLSQRLPELRAEFPDDPRLEALEAAQEVLAGAAPALEARRRLMRAASQGPALPATLVAFVARLNLALGFERAACDLAMEAAGPPVPQAWLGLSAMHVQIASSAPVQDVEVACEVARETLEQIRREGVLQGDRQHPPAWDVFANLGLYELHLGRVEAAVSAVREGVALADDSERRRSLAALARAIEDGRVERGRALTHVTVAFPLGPVLRAIARAERGAAVPADPLGAAEQILAEADRHPGRADQQAVALVSAARNYLQAGRSGQARQLLERAEALELQGDVRRLVVRVLAWVLVGFEGEHRRGEAFALEAAQPDPAGLATRGELADAWVTAANARLALGDRDGARAALEEAEGLEPWDRRALDALRERLR